MGMVRPNPHLDAVAMKPAEAVHAWKSIDYGVILLAKQNEQNNSSCGPCSCWVPNSASARNEWSP